MIQVTLLKIWKVKKEKKSKQLIISFISILFIQNKSYFYDSKILIIKLLLIYRVTNSEGNHNHSSFSRGSDIKLSQHNSNVQQYNKNLVSNSPNMFETKRKKFSPRSQSDRHLSSMHMKSVKSQLIEANGSQNLIISENDIIK